MAAARTRGNYVVEYINDTGAGRTISSLSTFESQGISGKTLRNFIDTASSPINFETGGGNVPANQSLGFTSKLLGRRECYLLEESPFAVSTGETVNALKQPFIWLPG